MANVSRQDILLKFRTEYVFNVAANYGIKFIPNIFVSSEGSSTMVLGINRYIDDINSPSLSGR